MEGDYLYFKCLLFAIVYTVDVSLGLYNTNISIWHSESLQVDANTDNKIGLEDIIHALQETAEIRP